MAKLILIETCFDCPYKRPDYDTLGSKYCAKTGTNIEDNAINDDCPLPDAPDEKGEV